MKVGQKSIVRWIAKRVAKRQQPVAPKSTTGFVELEDEQLRRVGGGTGSVQLPKVGGW